MGWRMRCEVHLAVSFEGELRVDDPDGIVVEARFVPPEQWDEHLVACAPWVREPLSAWLRERWEPHAARGLPLRGQRDDTGLDAGGAQCRNLSPTRRSCT